MPTLMIHHRRRLMLKKMTRYYRKQKMQDWKQQLIQLANMQFMGNHQEEDDEFPPHPGADIPFENIQFMSKSERMRWRQQYPNLPQYLFMSQKEKRSFFKQRSEKFYKKIEEMPQKISKTKKIVKFNSHFDVRPFRQNQIVTQIAKTASFKDSYHPQHFS